MSYLQIERRWRISALFKRDERRQTYRIDVGFQNRFRRTVLALALLTTAMTGLFSASVLYIVTNLDTLLDHLWVPVAFFALSWAFGGLIFYLCDRLSHRFCGPVYRILKELEAVRRGERPGPIRLRSGDEFQELAEALNATFDQFQPTHPPA
jgi:hypothetical protein